MKISGTSDLGRLNAMTKRARDTQAQMDRASNEMTTGLNSSRYEATAGNTTRIFAVERSIDRNEAFQQTIALTETRLDTMQNALGLVLSPLEDLAVDMASSVGLGDVSASLLHAQTARNAFKDTVGALNTQSGGLSLFAGTATDSPALASADSMLADLDALAQGATTAQDAIDAVNAYFAKPGGAFYSNGYLGTTSDSSPVDVGESRRLNYTLRADDDRLADVLRSQALAAVVAGGAFPGDSTAQMAILKASGDAMIASKEGLLDLRSAVGVSQNTLENAKAARVSEHDTLDKARSAILTVDPTTATATFKALETQLNAIYTVTARLGDLSYVNYMK